VPLFWRYPNFLVTQCRIGQKKHRLDPFPRFDTIPTCDTQTNEHTAIAITQGQSSTNQLQCIRHASYFGWGGKADGPKTEAKWPRVGAPIAKRFSCILEAPDGLSWNLLGAKFGGGMVPLPAPPLSLQVSLWRHSGVFPRIVVSAMRTCVGRQSAAHC